MGAGSRGERYRQKGRRGAVAGLPVQAERGEERQVRTFPCGGNR